MLVKREVPTCNFCPKSISLKVSKTSYEHTNKTKKRKRREEFAVYKKCKYVFFPLCYLHMLSAKKPSRNVINSDGIRQVEDPLNLVDAFAPPRSGKPKPSHPNVIEAVSHPENWKGIIYLLPKTVASISVTTTIVTQAKLASISVTTTIVTHASFAMFSLRRCCCCFVL